MEEKFSLQKARLGLGWTQEKLAEYLDITPEYISMMETGKKPVSKKVLKKFNQLEGKTFQDSSYGVYHSAAAPPGMVAEENNQYDGTLAQQEPHHSTLLRRIDALEIDVALLKKLILK